MNLIKVAAAVVNQTPFDWDNNFRNIEKAIAEAREAGATVLCLPELCVSGYGCEDAFHAPHVYETAWNILVDQIRPLTRDMIVSVGLPIRFTNGFYNAACLIADGKILGFVAKQFLAGDGIHYEPRWFKPWPNNTVAWLEKDGERYPIGDLYFNVGGLKIGFEICEDAWVAQRPGSDLSFKGVDLILNPSASHFSFQKLETRKRFVIEGSRAFGVTYIYSNLLGNEAGRAIYDGGALIASSGKLLSIGPRFSYQDVIVTTATVDIETSRVNLARTVSHRPMIDTDAQDCVTTGFRYPSIEPYEQERPFEAPWEKSDAIKEEEFARAVALSLFDYMRKSRSHGFVVSLSGGADSAAVAVLVGLSVWLGVKELGFESFLAKLGYIEKIQVAESPDEIVRQLLLCVYQATRNSSETTRSAAEAVAGAVGGEFMELDVDAAVENYKDMISGALGRELKWETDDIALQNIQARTRAPSVWMLTNIRRSLLLATSNRSEAAVGYATMDGDTAGGLSPIAGIDKAYLRSWLRWMESTGPLGHVPIPALDKINVQAPTAELRPSDRNQTDESDLMPYPLLDAIERAAIRDKKHPIDCFRLMRVKFPQYGPEKLLVWTERFFRLFCRNQWKRERYAPSFHLDDENLDPKTWCRFPILSGGYEREIAQLRDWVIANEDITIEESK